MTATYEQIMRLLIRRASPMRRGEHGPAHPHLAGTAMHEAGHALVAVAMHRGTPTAAPAPGAHRARRGRPGPIGGDARQGAGVRVGDVLEAVEVVALEARTARPSRAERELATTRPARRRRRAPRDTQ